jgi:hypothetical protein
LAHQIFTALLILANAYPAACAEMRYSQINNLFLNFKLVLVPHSSELHLEIDDMQTLRRVRTAPARSAALIRVPYYSFPNKPAIESAAAIVGVTREQSAAFIGVPGGNLLEVHNVLGIPERIAMVFDYGLDNKMFLLIYNKYSKSIIAIIKQMAAEKYAMLTKMSGVHEGNYERMLEHLRTQAPERLDQLLELEGRSPVIYIRDNYSKIYRPATIDAPQPVRKKEDEPSDGILAINEVDGALNATYLDGIWIVRERPFGVYEKVQLVRSFAELSCEQKLSRP